MTTECGAEVFFYEAFAEEVLALKRCLPATVAATYTADTIQEAGARTPPARLISVRTQSRIPPDWASSLAGILTRSTGYDHLRAFSRAARTAVPCGYLPEYCARAVAEQAFLLCLALLRRLPRQRQQMRHFTRDGLTGRECAGRTLVVAGVGRIGAEAARIGQGLGMRVFGVDPVQRWPWVQYLEHREAFARADVVICSMNLTGENANFFDGAMLARFRPGALFINVARGELADAAALLASVERGHLAGVGLDVYPEEAALGVWLRSGAGDRGDVPPALASVLQLLEHPAVLCTPHNAFNTEEAVSRKAQQSAAQITRLLAVGEFLWPVPVETAACRAD